MLPALGAAAVLALAGCDPDDVAAGGSGSAGGGQSAGGFGAGPLSNPDGTKPGLPGRGLGRVAGLVERLADV
ncbi:hypothetical protein AB0P40_37665, partial [Streptomyces sp. NPDC079189]